MTLSHLRPLESLAGVEIRLHDVHLYNAVYRFDDQMIADTLAERSPLPLAIS